MSAVKQTPGPWRWRGGTGEDYAALVSDMVGGPIIQTTHDVDPENPNAKLIAAAPALADALEDFVSDADVSLESMERVAADFKRDTGHLAPGKDEAAAVNSGVTDEERRHAWNIWVGKRRRDRLDRARAALRAAGRLP